jgi:membrane fusion protein, multidrug efflux system
LLIALGVALILVAAGYLVYWLLVGRDIESTDDAYLRADSVTVAPKVGRSPASAAPAPHLQ